MLRLVLAFLLVLRSVFPFRALSSSRRRPFVLGSVAKGVSPVPLLRLGHHRRRRRPRPFGGDQRCDATVDHANDGGEAKAESAPIQLSEERNATLFQFLLRDLQVEGVPLLSVDVPDVVDGSPFAHSVLQAALWTTMAEIADQQNQQRSQQQQEEKKKKDQDSDKDDDAAPVLNRACLVLENVPVPILQRFVDHFEQTLKADARATARFPELGQIRLSLVGKGVGPGLLVEATNASSTADALTADSQRSPEMEHRALAAMKMFVDRGGSTSPTAVQYRTCSFRDAYHIHSAFWNCVCEMLQSTINDPPPQHPSSTYLLLPELDDAMPVDDQQERFDVVTSMLTQSLELYATDTNGAAVEVSYYVPLYDRNKIQPANEFVRGHLPPLSWMGPDASVADDDASLWNYQRRSPVTACVIRYPADHEANARDDTEIASTTTTGGLEPVSIDATVVKRTLRVHQELVRQTLEQATVAERDVARGK
jgi:hypothetical protein